MIQTIDKILDPKRFSQASNVSNKFFPVDKLHLYILKKGKNASLKKEINYIYSH